MSFECNRAPTGAGYAASWSRRRRRHRPPGGSPRRLCLVTPSPGSGGRCSQRRIQVKQPDSFRRIPPRALFPPALTMLRLSGTIVANLLARLPRSNYRRLISVLGKFPSYMISAEVFVSIECDCLCRIGSGVMLETGLVSHTHDETTDCLVRHPTEEKRREL